MPAIEHVFVLMLENRSFDHMLGFSGLRGVNGLNGREVNRFGGVPYAVRQPALTPITVDPGHEFVDVLEQLCGTIVYAPHSAYPPIYNSGFVSNFASLPEFKKRFLRSRTSPRPDDVMQCFAPAQLPVLTALAQEFAVCDSWFCSMPGPTWPNRLFALAGSSAGLDHSPTRYEIGLWNTIRGFRFRNGSIFDRKDINCRIYSGQKQFTFAHALRGIHINSIRRYKSFADDVRSVAPKFDAQFTWIEPSYGHVATDFTNGTSQHPLDGVTAGEALIKATYEAIRNSPVWNSSLLVITWDEHGGFYDHVAPPTATPPGDTPYSASLNPSGFDFNQYGPRVPAIIVSPLIPRNIIDHSLYDHASILATLEGLFNLLPLTARDAEANDVLSLASLDRPRDDTPEQLPDAGVTDDTVLDTLDVEFPEASRPEEPVEQERDNLPGFLYLTTRAHLQMSPITQYPSIFLRSARVRTRRDARDYFEEVRRLLAAAERRQAIRVEYHT